MKNTYFSSFNAFSILATAFSAASVAMATVTFAAPAAPASATTDELCVESAADSIVDYLQKDEPGAKIAVVRNSQGALTGLTDENGFYSDLEFSNVLKDGTNTHIYEFRNGDFIVFATVTMFAPNGMLSCAVTDVDSGQDDQD